MIFVYRPRKSTSARALANFIDGVRSKDESRLRLKARPTDKVVMWGAYVNGIQARTLNNVPLASKFEDAVRLREAGIRTISVSRTMPVQLAPTPVIDPLIAVWEDAQEAAEAFTNLAPTRSSVAMDGLGQLGSKIMAVRNAMAHPAPVPIVVPVETWLARRSNHVGGNDLLNPISNPDYYSKKEEFVNEYRIHSFLDRSIRAGRKIPRTALDETPFIGVPHEWIRSFDGGWKISYAEDFAASNKKQAIRDLAHNAVKTLGLQFGAVDIGELASGELVVLEVNRAPGIETGTIEAYGRGVRRWIDGEWAPQVPAAMQAV